MKSQDAYKLFQEDSEAFTAYHEGYNNQTKSWPKNPVDMIIQTIEKMLDIIIKINMLHQLLVHHNLLQLLYKLIDFAGLKTIRNL